MWYMIRMEKEIKMSDHFSSRKASAIRVAQIEYAKRKDNVKAVNVSIGNVGLPIYPALKKRLKQLGSKNSPFHNGILKYTATKGESETHKAFLNIISSSGFSTDNLNVLVTDGGSQAMEIIIAGVCGKIDGITRPLLLIDAAYTNYALMANRLQIPTVSISRKLQKNGKFTLPNFTEIENVIEQYNPSAMVVIPYDNPTGQFCDLDSLKKLAELAVKHNLWFISDEAYRELYYVKKPVSSIWGITDKMVEGIEERRIGIESASKVWNACGLRIGALITDNQKFYEKAEAEYTANLCANAQGQYIFGALAEESHEKLKKWYKKQQRYYKKIMFELTTNMKKFLPGIMISKPEAAIYSVIDVKNIVNENFDAGEFVLFCAEKGKVNIEETNYTLLASPMMGFYNVKNNEPNPGKTQMRISYVETPEKMRLVPKLLAELLKEYSESLQPVG
jgi:aspartate aminotransferase